MRTDGTDEAMCLNAASPPGSGHVREILGTRQIWKTRADETGGALVCVEIVVPPGLGIPLHRHSNEDETFYVIAGQAVFEGDDCGDGPIRLDPGSVFFAPRGRLHAFHNRSQETVRLLSVVTPGGPTEALFSELEDLSVRQNRPVDAVQVVEACRRYGIVFPNR